jgi:hypothetical protein
MCLCSAIWVIPQSLGIGRTAVGEYICRAEVIGRQASCGCGPEFWPQSGVPMTKSTELVKLIERLLADAGQIAHTDTRRSTDLACAALLLSTWLTSDELAACNPETRQMAERERASRRLQTFFGLTGLTGVLRCLLASGKRM